MPRGATRNVCRIFLFEVEPVELHGREPDLAVVLVVQLRDSVAAVAGDVAHLTVTEGGADLLPDGEIGQERVP